MITWLKSLNMLRLLTGGRGTKRIYENIKQQRFLELAIDEQKYSSTPYCVYASKKTKWNDQVDIGFVYRIMYLVHSHSITYESARGLEYAEKRESVKKYFNINKVTDKG